MPSPLSILIVDDDVPLRSALRALIRMEPTMRFAGEAGDGETAVRLARELAPDVVLMDVCMPGAINGLEATRQIVSAGGDAGPMVIAVSSADDRAADAVDAGAIGFVSKGLAGHLVDAIRATIERQRA